MLFIEDDMTRKSGTELEMKTVNTHNWKICVGRTQLLPTPVQREAG